MRLTAYSLRVMLVSAIAMWISFPFGMHAQFFGTSPKNDFIAMASLRPAPGSDVSVIVFEDLGCPACAYAHRIEIEITQKYHIPLVRYDFPIKSHIWTFDGAVNARYLQKEFDAELAESYRGSVFEAQSSIGSKDDLRGFTVRWLQQHGRSMPLLVDPSGLLAAMVQADYDRGRSLNVQFTPTIIVVTKRHYQVVSGIKDGPNDLTQLDAVVRSAIAQTKNSVAKGKSTFMQ